MTPAQPELARERECIEMAVASKGGGTVRPSDFAVLRLMTSSNLVGCTTGRSAGLGGLLHNSRARVHYASGQCGWRVAACGGRAAADAGDRIFA
jgi:hypothetical protein